jgi:hypothetical protein
MSSGRNLISISIFRMEKGFWSSVRYLREEEGHQVIKTEGKEYDENGIVKVYSASPKRSSQSAYFCHIGCYIQGS